MKRLIMDSFVVGLALFAMFFGAGNIIFPPYIGLGAGSEWATGFFFYYVADIGLALVAIFALIRSQNIERAEGIMLRLGKTPARLMMGAVVICIGPLLAVPRTAVISYEMAGKPLLGDIGLPAFVIGYFALAFIVSVKESDLVNIVGRFLTPLLVIGLCAMVIAGVVAPLGAFGETVRVDNLVWTSVSAGYQTMDVLGALAFGLIIVNDVRAKGYTSERQRNLSVALAGGVAGGILLVIYGGLCYLGATVSTVSPMDIDMGQLVVNIAHGLLGDAGALILGGVVLLACLTTAIALIGAAGTFFSSFSRGRLPYSWLVGGICVFSAIVGNFGLKAIIAIAEPVLTVIYPGALVVVILSLFNETIKNDNVFKGAALGAMLTSVCEVLHGFGVPWLPFGFIKELPLQCYGFAWVLPAVVCGCLGACIPSSRQGADAPVQEAAQ